MIAAPRLSAGQTVVGVGWHSGGFGGIALMSYRPRFTRIRKCPSLTSRLATRVPPPARCTAIVTGPMYGGSGGDGSAQGPGQVPSSTTPWTPADSCL